MIEIHAHGGPVALRRVLEVVLAAGAELAAPGEFTRRAFMAGRIDLSQAEAVAELIEARSRAEAELAAVQLAGGLKDRVEAMRKTLIDILAHIEVAIDFPEDEAEILDGPCFARRVEDEVLEPVKKLLDDYESGRVYREGLAVAIVGRPNVGKSSLLNAILKREKAIVAPLPGTTRDEIEAEALICGLNMTLIDTAGLASVAADVVEAEGQRRAAVRLESSDLALVVMDGSMAAADEDRRILEAAPKGRAVLVRNKVDLGPGFEIPGDMILTAGGAPVDVSALTGQGLDDLRRCIFDAVTGGAHRSMSAVPELVPNVRHRRALEAARPDLARVVDGFRKGLAPELLALEIQAALERLGTITGRTTPEDVLDTIFSSFCLGK